MSRLVALIVLCGMGMSVFSDTEPTDCIFDWESFITEGNSEDIVIDYSGQAISTLTEGSKTYHYITGPVTTRSEVGDSYDVFYEIQRYSAGKEEPILLDVRKVCYFLEEVYPKFLLPIGGTHNDFAPQESICPMKVGTTNIYPAKNSQELVAPSVLENGKYYLFVSFLKDNNPVGGISGNFTVLRD